MAIINKIANERNLLEKYLTKEQIDEYLTILSNLKEDELYDSKVHGLYHSQKVCLFALILADSYELSEIDKKIIIDAALYHDIGRISDQQDEIHGIASAIKILSVVDDELYDDVNNVILLQSIIDNHSRPHYKEKDTFEYYVDQYGIKPSEELYQRYKLLNQILRDSDALDRNRFADGYTYGLNEKFLKLSKSISLIDFSREINDIYTDLAMPKINIEEIETKKGDCYHSVGFDVFKISSILENGILSHAKLSEKNLSGMKNFNGGNSRNWISVVDPTIKESNTRITAFNEFTLNGINFVCTRQSLVKPLPPDVKKSKALETGMPFNKSGYCDERYVYEEIHPKMIDETLLYASSAAKKINETTFIYNSLDYRTFLSRVNHYIKETKASSLGYNVELLTSLLDSYKGIIDEYLEKSMHNEHSYSKEELNEKLSGICTLINAVIQEMMMKYYSILLNKPGKDIRIYEIVEYEISKNKYTFKEQIYDDKIVYKIIKK